jgi:hypothetical protein
MVCARPPLRQERRVVGLNRRSGSLHSRAAETLRYGPLAMAAARVSAVIGAAIDSREISTLGVQIRAICAPAAWLHGPRAASAGRWPAARDAAALSRRSRWQGACRCLAQAGAPVGVSAGARNWAARGTPRNLHPRAGQVDLLCGPARFGCQFPCSGEVSVTFTRSLSGAG